METNKITPDFDDRKRARAGTFAGWSGMLQRPQNTIAGNPIK